VYLFVLASEVYHDVFWWNLKGRRILEDWKKSSPWGKLWENYT